MGANYRLEKRNFPPPAAVGPPEMIAVLEQGGAIPNLQYRAASNYTRERDETGFVRGVVTYATGSHQLTLGAGDGIGRGEAEVYSRNPLSYRFREGIPNQLTMQATPHTQVVDVDHDLGVFAEHQWTLGRLTSVFGLRYDYFANSFPDQYLGPGPLMPSRSVFFPARSNVAWHDVTPRVGLAWDVSGTGRTKVQASLGKFPAGYGTLQSGLTSDANPIALVPQTALRSWIDGNGNYQPDCDILNPADQDNRARGGDRCGALNPSNFGTSDPNKSFDPNLLRGSGKRDYNWLFAVGGEHELSRGVVLSGGYFQRQYRNFQVTDNRAVGPGDFDTFSIVAPIDSRLPGGGGNTVTGFPNVTPMLFGQVDNFVTLSSHYGEQIDLWRGVDVTLRARLANGLLVRGGVSTGRLTTDNCDIVAQSPETLQGGAALRVPIGASAWLPASFCHQESPFLTQVRAYGVYEIPTIDVLVSGVFQSLPGVPVLAQYQASRIEVQEALGRLPSGSENNVVVHLVKPGTMYGERLYQFDLRFTKVFRLGNQMLSLNADIYNLFNASTVLAQNNTFSPNPEGGPAAWQTPTEILQARLLKLGAQFRF
jgi:hypothetical protein